MTGPIKTITAGRMKVEIFATRDEMGKKAAADVGKKIRELLKEQSEVNVVFAAAPSQNETLGYLCLEEGIDWTRVNAFHMDEYIGLSADEKQSFVGYLNEHVAHKLPFKSFHSLRGDASDPESECVRYARLLASEKIDVVCLGIGENGHIAFNDPHEAYVFDEKLVKIVSLDEKCRNQQVHDKCFDKLGDVPKKAMTLTIPALMRGKYLFCTVPSELKAAAVKEAIHGEIRNECPATFMRLHDNVTMYCDAYSAKYVL